jgi:hypothetical protein
MATETKLKWVEVSWDRVSQHSQRGRVLWVSDGTHGRVTALPSSVSIRDALEHYAEVYVVGIGKREVEVTYQMWEAGQMWVSGTHAFEVNP